MTNQLIPEDIEHFKMGNLMVMLPSDRGQTLGQTSGFRNEKMAKKQNHDETQSHLSHKTINFR